MQNTVFGYKKGLKNESDKIFWILTPKMCVVSFATFVSKSFFTNDTNSMNLMLSICNT